MNNLGNGAVHKHKTKCNYSCALCPYSTTIFGNYNKHLKIHSNDKPFKCSECPFKSKWENSVKVHLKHVHLLRSPSAARPFPCPESGCNYAAKDKKALKRHSNIHSGEKSFICSHPNCYFSSNRTTNLQIHIRRHTGKKPFVCQFESCYYVAVTQAELVRHSRTHTKEKPYKCPEENCEYSASMLTTIKRHQLIHEPEEGEERPSFKCPICEYKGETRQYLSKHIKSHTLEKLFKCDGPNCNFVAKTKENLESHKLVHSDEKPFACSVESCSNRFKSKSHLNSHLKTHSEERQYKCELCPYRGKTRTVVRSHIKYVHSDFRPFKCPITEPKCDFASNTKRDLSRHALIRKGHKKYSCPFPGCDYRAVLEGMVQSHVRRCHKSQLG